MQSFRLFPCPRSLSLSDLSPRCIHHFDLYRIESIDAFCESGFDEYLQSDAIVLVEWPAVIAPLLAERSDVLAVRLSYDADAHDVRVLEINPAH